MTLREAVGDTFPTRVRGTMSANVIRIDSFEEVQIPSGRVRAYSGVDEVMGLAYSGLEDVAGFVRV